MKYPLNSYMDLAFLIPNDWYGTTPLPYKFVVFFNKIADSIEAAKYLRSQMPLYHHHKVKWFNSEMSVEFRNEESAKLKMVMLRVSHAQSPLEWHIPPTLDLLYH